MGRRIQRIIPPLIGGTILIGLMLYMAGVFRTGEIGPQDAVSSPPAIEVHGKRVAAQKVSLPQFYEAVGTLQARSTAQIESQIRARIGLVAVRSGDRISAGQKLIELDDRQLNAQLEQARQALQGAQQERVQSQRRIDASEAALARTRSQHQRIQNFLAAGAATEQEMEQIEAELRQTLSARDQAVAGLKRAQAGVEQARRRLEEAKITLDYTLINSPLTGQVIERRADPGDLAMPGKVLLTLESDSFLQLEAQVPESLVNRLALGQEVDMEIDQRSFSGRVAEIVPSADPASRTFTTKVILADRNGLHSGMFGRLLIALDERTAILAPAEAILRIGQLETVRIVSAGQVRNQLVTTGMHRGSDVEILSGLRGDETLLVPGEE
ncbi:MAG TPA: efflux RND transporter periplasmic adaptor subunit [Geoalkalibacter subterraneus]|uniref:Efflux RND transporter periplasmic adaptor subunit n=1 Tax=Geoalkalibacter subterraneus TaxID=483547 RepID=A0A831LGQ3_9BACT|nr:efflux RND transporter periplasmic adaptor subunit [Geoalkalibacter subterraneus]